MYYAKGIDNFYIGIDDTRTKVNIYFDLQHFFKNIYSHIQIIYFYE